VFVGGGDSTAELGSRTQPLAQSEDDQQYRREDADRSVRGDESDQARRDAHQHEGDGQYPLAADLVAEVAEEDSAERADDESDGERGEGGEGPGDGALTGEEDLAEDERGHRGEQIEVEPLERRADHNGRADFALGDRGRRWPSWTTWPVRVHCWPSPSPYAEPGQRTCRRRAPRSAARMSNATESAAMRRACSGVWISVPRAVNSLSGSFCITILT
jgi:hypothetical protein